MLVALTSMVDEVPALKQPMRYGNKAFCSWVELVEKRAPDMLLGILPEHCHSAVVELVPYLCNSFGHGIVFGILYW